MQIGRFGGGGETRYGALEGPSIVVHSGTPVTTFRRGRRPYPLEHVVLLAPVVPSKIVGIGLNYWAGTPQAWGRSSGATGSRCASRGSGVSGTPS